MVKVSMEQEDASNGVLVFQTEWPGYNFVKGKHFKQLQNSGNLRISLEVRYFPPHPSLPPQNNQPAQQCTDFHMYQTLF